MTNDERLANICNDKLLAKNLNNVDLYKKRLNWELKEIEVQKKAEYFISLFENKTRYAENQNNLLVPYLLGVVNSFDIDEDPNCEYGDWPDIDIDYLNIVRDYLKTEWAPKTFGEQYVCNISTYGTFKLKNALLDMARVHGKDRNEIQAITKTLEDKDEDGKPLTWDSALKMHPELKKYCEENADVAEAARRILHRNKSIGVHAGGLIIANQPLSNLVPLVKRKSDPQAAAWTEGLSGQDLGPIGLIKFDLLVIDGLLQIAYACRLAKQRHNLPGICAKPGLGDWTDLEAWRNDPETLATADRGDLTGIFQFDSIGIQKLAREGGVTRFEDLAAYSAIFRPGPLSCLREDTKIKCSEDKNKQIKDLNPGLDEIAFVNKQGTIQYTKNYFLTKTGKKKIFKITTKSGKTLYASADHRILSADTYVKSENLKIGDKISCVDAT